MLRSFGLDNRQEMTITDMASALAGFKFEYIYFNCCYMGSVEVIYELRDNAPLIVASPAEVPFDGMPYQTTLPLLAKGRPVDAAKATAAHYEGRTGSYCPSTFGAIRTGALDALAEATADVYRTAIQGPLPDTFTPQRFSVNSNNNFFDLEQYVEAITTDPALLDRWRKALDDAVISQSHSPRCGARRCCATADFPPTYSSPGPTTGATATTVSHGPHASAPSPTTNHNP